MYRLKFNGLHLIIFAFVSLQAQAKIDKIAYKEAEQYFQIRGITAQCSEVSFKNLKKLVQELLEKDNLQKLLIDDSKNPLTIESDQEEEIKEYLDLTHMQLDHNEVRNCSDAEKYQAYQVGRAMVYSILVSTHENSIMNIGDWASMVGNSVITVPYLSEKERTKAIGPKQALKEANNLINIKSGKVYSSDDLAKLSAYHIAALDIGSKHPMWRTQEEIEKEEWNGVGRWKILENIVSKKVTKKFLKKCHEDECQALQTPYNLTSAKKILVFSKIKTSATSPKIDAKDLYGQKWKVKWGVEANVEPFASRLYIKLGAKFTDLSYSNGKGSNDLILILDSMEQKSSCAHINNFEWFSYCLKISSYQFNPMPYVDHWGVITEQNIESLFGIKKDLIKETSFLKKYIGRTWITFKESMVEFSSENTFSKLGSGPENHLGFENDRVLRGLALVAAWMGNDDAKEDNSRSILLPNNDSYDYVHYWHDLGSALGSTIYAGKINSLKTDHHFAYFSKGYWKNSPRFMLPLEIVGPTWVVFPRLHLYKPKSWDKATYSDALWMASKIVNILEEDLVQLAKTTEWPSFVQEALIGKLMSRRIRMGKIFALPYPGVQDSYPLTIRYNFNSAEVRAKLAKSFDLNPTSLENAYQDYVKKSGKEYDTETVVKDGEVVDCQHSLLVNLLEKYNYPSGLARRMSRLNYKNGLSDCQFNGP